MSWLGQALLRDCLQKCAVKSHSRMVAMSHKSQWSGLWQAVCFQD